MPESCRHMDVLYFSFSFSWCSLAPLKSTPLAFMTPCSIVPPIIISDLINYWPLCQNRKARTLSQFNCWRECPGNIGAGAAMEIRLTATPQAWGESRLADPMVGYWCRVGSLALTHTRTDIFGAVAILDQVANNAQQFCCNCSVLERCATVQIFFSMFMLLLLASFATITGTRGESSSLIRTIW